MPLKSGTKKDEHATIQLLLPFEPSFQSLEEPLFEGEDELSEEKEESEEESIG